LVKALFEWGQESIVGILICLFLVSFAHLFGNSIGVLKINQAEAVTVVVV